LAAPVDWIELGSPDLTMLATLAEREPAASPGERTRAAPPVAP
jgi:hypothetical protein